MSESSDKETASPTAEVEKVLDTTDLKESLQECTKNEEEGHGSEEGSEKPDEKVTVVETESSTVTSKSEISGELMPLILDELQNTLDTRSACSGGGGGGGCNEKKILKVDSRERVKEKESVAVGRKKSEEGISLLLGQTGKNNTAQTQDKTNRGVPISKKEVNEKEEYYEEESDDESGTTDGEGDEDDDDEDENESFETISSDEQDSRPPETPQHKPPDDAQFSSIIDGIRNSLTSTKLDSASIANSANEADRLKSAIQSSEPPESDVLQGLYRSLRLLESSFVPAGGSESSPFVPRCPSKDNIPTQVDKTELINLIDRLKSCLVGRGEVQEVESGQRQQAPTQAQTNNSTHSAIISASSSKDSVVSREILQPDIVPQTDSMAQNKQESISSSESAERVPWQVRANKRRTKTRSYSTGVTPEEIAEARKYLEDEAMKNSAPDGNNQNQISKGSDEILQSATPQVFRDNSVPDITTMAYTSRQDGSEDYGDPIGSQKFGSVRNDFPFLKGSLQYYPPSSQVVSNQELFYPAAQKNVAPKYKPFRTLSLDSDYETGHSSITPDQQHIQTAVYEAALRKQMSEDEGQRRRINAPMVKYGTDFGQETPQHYHQPPIVNVNTVPVNVTNPTRVTYQIRPGSTGQISDGGTLKENHDRQLALPFTSSPISINSNLGGSNRVDNVQISLTEFNSAEFPAQLQIAITLKSNNSNQPGYPEEKNSVQSIDVKLNNELDNMQDENQACDAEVEMSSNPKINRYQSKKDRKKRMKRANTIDIPQPPGLITTADLDDDDETEDSNLNVSHVPFQPKTEGDRKFLAFLEKNNAFETNKSTRPTYLAANDRQWNNRFSNLKTSFESGGSSPSVSPTPLFHKGKSVADIAMAQNLRATPEIVSKPIWASNRVSPLPSNVKHKLQVFESVQNENISPTQTREAHHSPFMSSQMKTSFMNTSQDKPVPKFSQRPNEYKSPINRQPEGAPAIPPTLIQQSVHTKLPQPLNSPTAHKHEGVHMVHATASAMHALNQPKKPYMIPPQGTPLQPFTHTQPASTQPPAPENIVKPTMMIKKPEGDQAPRVSSARSVFETRDAQNQGVVAGKLSLSLNDDNVMPKRPERKHFEKDMSFHTSLPNVPVPTQPVPPPRNQPQPPYRDHPRQEVNLQHLHYPQPVSLKTLGVSKSFDENYGRDRNMFSNSVGPVPNMKLNASSKSSFASVIPRKAVQPLPQSVLPKPGGNQLRSPVPKVFPIFDEQMQNQQFPRSSPPSSLVTGQLPSPVSKGSNFYEGFMQLSRNNTQSSQSSNNGNIAPSRPAKATQGVPESFTQPSQSAPSSSCITPDNTLASPTTKGPSIVDGFMQIKTRPNQDSSSVQISKNESFDDGMILTPVVSKVMRGPEQQRATFTTREMSSLNDDKPNRRSTAISNISNILNQYQNQPDTPPQLIRPQPNPSPPQSSPPAPIPAPIPAPRTSIPPQAEVQPTQVKEKKQVPESSTPTNKVLPLMSPPQIPARDFPAPTNRVDNAVIPRQKSLSDLPKVSPSIKFTNHVAPLQTPSAAALPQQSKQPQQPQPQPRKLVKLASMEESQREGKPEPPPPSVAEIKKAFMRQNPGRSADQIQRTASGTSIFERTKSLYISVQDLPPPPTPKKKGPALPRSKYFFPKQYEAQMSPDSADKKQRELQAYFTKPSSSKNSAHAQHLRKSASHSKIMHSQQSQAGGGDEDVDQIFESLFKATGHKKVGTSVVSSTKSSTMTSSSSSATTTVTATASSKVEEKSSSTAAGTKAGAPIFQFTNPALKTGAASAKEILLYWCQCRTRDYQNIKIENFSSSWSNGLAFCALVHHYFPDAFDYQSLDPKNRRKNFDLAFKVAEEKADIYPLLDTEDMLIMGNRPDWKCVFTYVQSMYRKLKDRD